MSKAHKINGLIWLLSHVTFKTKLKVVGSKFHFNKYPTYDICYDVQTYFENLGKDKYEEELGKWYKVQTGHECNFVDPQRFTEKIQWMKLYGFSELETKLADKYLVRDWVEEKIGKEYLIPLLGVWETVEEIDFNKLPSSFVLKGNHGSKMNLIVRDKKELDINETRIILEDWLKENFAFCLGGFEMQYLNIPRRIIAEQLMTDRKSKDLNDYKFHCFSGKPYYCEVICDRSLNESIDFFDMEWVHQDFVDEPAESQIKNAATRPNKPSCFDEMICVATKLSAGFPYVRVDLYEVDGKVYFGEMTFTPAGGADRFTPDSADYDLGKLFRLPNGRRTGNKK